MLLSKLTAWSLLAEGHFTKDFFNAHEVINTRVGDMASSLLNLFVVETFFGEIARCGRCRCLLLWWINLSTSKKSATMLWFTFSINWCCMYQAWTVSTRRSTFSRFLEAIKASAFWKTYLQCSKWFVPFCDCDDGLSGIVDSWRPRFVGGRGWECAWFHSSLCGICDTRNILTGLDEQGARFHTQPTALFGSVFHISLIVWDTPCALRIKKR